MAGSATITGVQHYVLGIGHPTNQLVREGQPGAGGEIVNAGTSFTLTAADDGKVFNCTTALTITIPASLSPRPNIAVIPPASGNVSIAVSGGAQINGATTTLTRARAGNPAGFVIQPYSEADGYGVSGS